MTVRSKYNPAPNHIPKTTCDECLGTIRESHAIRPTSITGTYCGIDCAEKFNRRHNYVHPDQLTGRRDER